MSRLHEALTRARPEGEPAPEADRERAGFEVFAGGRSAAPAPWTFRARAPETPAVPDRPAPTVPEPSAPPDAVTSEAPRRRSFPLWLLAALVAVAVASYVVARATGIFGEPGPLRLTGVVTGNEVVVAAKTAGRIEKLAVQEGTRVKQGDLIARLDREELDAERQHQLAQIEQLGARLRQAREVVDLEGERGAGRVASAKAQLGTARSQSDEAVATVEQARKDAERARSLFAEGLVPRQDVERAETELRVTEARERSLADQVVRAEAELQLARANEGQTGVARRDVEQTAAQLAQARAQLAQVAAREAYTEVHAPLGGLVSLRVAREGEVIRLGDPIVTIVDLDDVWVRAEVEEGSLGRVAVGQSLEVELASGERLTGRVTLVEAEAQFATQRDVSRVKRDIRTFGIKVALSNPERRLHQGMTAYVYLPQRAAGR